MIRRLLFAVVLIGALLLATLAMPVHTWRTGDPGQGELRFDVQFSGADGSRRVWIDADAACGEGSRVDPDDCLALLWFARSHRHEWVGFSTVFGNAPLPGVERVSGALMEHIRSDGTPAPALYSGAAEPSRGVHGPPTAAVRGLIRALEQGPLTVLALGPLTNIAAALGERPDLAAQVELLVAVMGKRPGHVFHPAEGAQARSWLGHGPVFRDFNVALDPDAVAAVLAMKLPLVLVPYDAARGLEIGEQDVQDIARAGSAGAWVAPRLRGWLHHWQSNIGRAGFFPFDLMAARLLVDRQGFGCARATASLHRSPWPLRALGWSADLLVTKEGSANGAAPSAPALYCAQRPQPSRVT